MKFWLSEMPPGPFVSVDGVPIVMPISVSKLPLGSYPTVAQSSRVIQIVQFCEYFILQISKRISIGRLNNSDDYHGKTRDMK